MSEKRRYDEGCLGAHALNLVGDRWALLVVRELIWTPKRFQTLQAGLPGITPSVLSGRLAQLQAAGVLTHQDGGLYALTPDGQALLPVLQTLCRWGARAPGHDPARFISPTALTVSMTAMIGPAAGIRTRAALRMGAEAFVLDLDRDGVLRVTATPAPQGAFALSAPDGNAMAVAIYGPQRLEAQRAAQVTGDRGRAQAFVDLFHLNRKAPT